jgi:hypothetical protein
MRTGVHNGGVNRRKGNPALPGAGQRGLAAMFALAAAAGLVVLGGTMTGTTAAPAAASVSSHAVTAAHSRPMFEPCPCDKPICRPGCVQNTASGGPAAVIHRQVRTARAATAAAHARPMVEPCPCDNPVCRPVCHQN